MKEQKQKRLAWHIWWFCIILLTLGIAAQLIFADCLPCCPGVIGGGCPGEVIDAWNVCCTKYSTYGHVHIGCCDYRKYKIACMGGGSVVLYLLQDRHFNDPDYIWICASTNVEGRCLRQSRPIAGR